MEVAKTLNLKSSQMPSGPEFTTHPSEGGGRK